MLKPLPIPFPGVSEKPIVTELAFVQSEVTVKGHFELNEFATLGAENLEFLRLYIKVRGNLKEVERILGLSYPTIRARFESLLRDLGYEPTEPHPSEQTLELLERGEITPEEALCRLKR